MGEGIRELLFRDVNALPEGLSVKHADDGLCDQACAVTDAASFATLGGNDGLQQGGVAALQLIDLLLLLIAEVDELSCDQH
ncbi:hypothetical protein D3C71_2113090 [compost metagenome]